MFWSLANRVYRLLFPRRRFCSGSVDHPTPADLYIAMLQKLVQSGRWMWVNFDTPSSKDWIQVALSGRKFELNFSYPYDDDPSRQFARSGIEIPHHWTLAYLKPKRAATLEAPVDDLCEVAGVVNQIYQNVFGCPSNYDATAHFE